MNRPPTHYEVLKVSSDAPVEVIRAAFKALALKYHPDTNHSADAHIQMGLINTAYMTLSDPERRRAYDENLRNQSAPHQNDPGRYPRYAPQTDELWQEPAPARPPGGAQVRKFLAGAVMSGVTALTFCGRMAWKAADRLIGFIELRTRPDLRKFVRPASAALAGVFALAAIGYLLSGSHAVTPKRASPPVISRSAPPPAPAVPARKPSDVTPAPDAKTSAVAGKAGNTAPATALPPMFARDPKALDRKIGDITGLQLVKADGDGRQPLPDGENAPDAKYRILYRNKPVLEVADPAAGFYGLRVLGNEKIVIVWKWRGDTACHPSYDVISLREEEANYVGDMGDCEHPEPKISGTGDAITFSFFDAFGERLVYQYRDGRLTRTRVALPLVDNRPARGGARAVAGYAYLLPYVERSELEGILRDRTANGVLTKMLGGRYAEFARGLLIDSMWASNDYIFAYGVAPGGGADGESFLALSTRAGDIYAAVLTTTPKDSNPGEPTSGAYIQSRTVTIYSNPSSLYARPPEELKSWAGRIGDAKTVWKFSDIDANATAPKP